MRNDDTIAHCGESADYWSRRVLGDHYGHDIEDLILHGGQGHRLTKYDYDSVVVNNEEPPDNARDRMLFEYAEGIASRLPDGHPLKIEQQSRIAPGVVNGRRGYKQRRRDGEA